MKREPGCRHGSMWGGCSVGKANFRYAFPECCVRYPFVVPAWTNSGPAQDQQYFSKLIESNGWSTAKDDVIINLRYATYSPAFHNVASYLSGDQ